LGRPGEVAVHLPTPGRSTVRGWLTAGDGRDPDGMASWEEGDRKRMAGKGGERRAWRSSPARPLLVSPGHSPPLLSATSSGAKGLVMFLDEAVRADDCVSKEIPRWRPPNHGSAVSHTGVRGSELDCFSKPKFHAHPNSRIRGLNSRFSNSEPNSIHPNTDFYISTEINLFLDGH
jgi:hypothetical protein